MVHEFMAKLNSALITQNIQCEIRKPVFDYALQISGRLIFRRQLVQFGSLLGCWHGKLCYLNALKEFLWA